jgi:hypothetical protein
MVKITPLIDGDQPAPSVKAGGTFSRSVKVAPSLDCSESVDISHSPETLTPLRISPVKLPKIIGIVQSNSESTTETDALSSQMSPSSPVLSESGGSSVDVGGDEGAITEPSPNDATSYVEPQDNTYSHSSPNNDVTLLISGNISPIDEGFIHVPNSNNNSKVLFHSDSPPIPSNPSDRSTSGTESASSAGSSFLSEIYPSRLSARISAKFSPTAATTPTTTDQQAFPFEIVLVKRAARRMTIKFRHRAQCSFCIIKGQCRKCGVLDGVARMQIDFEGRALLSGVATATWITDDILAMSRPTMRSIPDFRFDEQLKAAGVTAIFNTEEPGEHPYCGGEIAQDGFTYSVEAFESAGVKVHNFGWVDLSIPSLQFIHEAVKLAVDTLKRGEKIAVHCHAGFGRTGVLIACILLNLTSMNASEVIDAVRARRPKCIENRLQKKFVYRYARFIKPADAMAKLFDSDASMDRSIDDDFLLSDTSAEPSPCASAGRRVTVL